MAVVLILESFDASSTSFPQSSEVSSLSALAVLVLVLEDVSDVVVLVVEDVSDCVVVLSEDMLDVDVLPVPADPTLPHLSII